MVETALKRPGATTAINQLESGRKVLAEVPAEESHWRKRENGGFSLVSGRLVSVL